MGCCYTNQRKYNLHQWKMCLNLVEHLFQKPLQNNKIVLSIIFKKNRKCMHSVITVCCSSTNLVLQAVYGFPISKQQSYNQEWQELGTCINDCKNTSRHVRQALKLHNLNSYYNAQILVTFSSSLLHKNPFHSA
jgi:hypothetical protein